MNLSSNLNDELIHMNKRKQRKISKSVNDCYNNKIDENNINNNPTETDLNVLRKREYLSALSNLNEYLKKKRTFLSTS